MKSCEGCLCFSRCLFVPSRLVVVLSESCFKPSIEFVADCDALRSSVAPLQDSDDTSAAAFLSLSEKESKSKRRDNQPGHLVHHGRGSLHYDHAGNVYLQEITAEALRFTVRLQTGFI